MKLIVDVMGFEGNLKDAISASRDFMKKNKIDITLVGNENLIKPYILSSDKFEIVHSDVEIQQTDKIIDIRRKKNSSMEIAANLVKNNEGDGLLSAGQSSIFIFLMYKTFGLIPGIKKPGFMPFIPTFESKKSGFNLIDVGASITCDAEDLYNFAIMANIYAKGRGIENPTVAILNIGTEEKKGFEYHWEVHEKLKENPNINYVGYVEPKGILDSAPDVIVTDGYAGNLVLKSIEGSTKIIFRRLLEKYKKPWNLFALLVSSPILLSMKKRFDYKNYAGAFVIGLNKIAVKTHGNAGYKEFYSSLRMLKETIDGNILDKIKETISEEIQ